MTLIEIAAIAMAATVLAAISRMVLSTYQEEEPDPIDSYVRSLDRMTVDIPRGTSWATMSSSTSVMTIEEVRHIMGVDDGVVTPGRGRQIVTGYTKDGERVGKCGWCGTKLFEHDRSCPGCGAPAG